MFYEHFDALVRDPLATALAAMAGLGAWIFMTSDRFDRILKRFNQRK